MIKANIGDAHAMGNKPIVFIRQVQHNFHIILQSRIQWYFSLSQMRRCLLWSLIPLCLKVMNFLRMPRTGLSCPAPPPYPTLTVPSKVCLCVSLKALNLSSASVVASFGCEYFSSGFPNLMMAGHEQFLLGARVGLLAHTATRQALRFEYDQFLKNKRSEMWDNDYSFLIFGRSYDAMWPNTLSIEMGCHQAMQVETKFASKS